MELTPKELMKQYVDSQNFTSTTQIMQAMKELFRDAIQQVTSICFVHNHTVCNEHKLEKIMTMP